MWQRLLQRDYQIRRSIERLKDIIEGSLATPERAHGHAHFHSSGRRATLPAHAVERTAEKNALRSIEGGDEVQALANIDVEAESLYAVSNVIGENLMIQTQTAMACKTVKKKLLMENDTTNRRHRGASLSWCVCCRREARWLQDRCLAPG